LAANINTDHDVANGRFIVQYDGVSTVFGDLLTFQFVIMDDDHSYTETGDNEFYMFYNNVRYTNNTGIGIQNKDATVALNYLVNGSYRPGAGTINPSTAIKITTNHPEDQKMPWLAVHTRSTADTLYGDGNGRYTEGERIEVSLNIRNLGTAPLDDVLVRLRKTYSNTFTTINDSIVNYGRINAGQTVVSPSPLSFTVSTLSGPRDASFEVWIVSSDFSYHTVQSFSIPVRQFTGIDENTEFLPENMALITAYPNPFNSMVNIDLTGFDSGKNTVLQISDVLGHIVYEGSISSSLLLWNPGNLPSGLYFINVFSDNLTARSKVLYVR
jgi:hypothetical protein